MKIYKITTTQIWTERDYIEKATVDAILSKIPIEGYSRHRGYGFVAEYPKFNDDGEQISGAKTATFKDAVAWFAQDALSVKFEEIEGD